MAGRVLVSACLLGDRVRFDGKDKGTPNPVLARWLAEGRVVKVCPEVSGGLAVPRPPAEQRDGGVFTKEGRDVSSEFERGAAEALRLVREHGIKVAVMKEGSPSCGSGFVYDGTFTKTRIEGGEGVTVALLRANGVQVFSEHQWEDADRVSSSAAGD
ncbi:MAG TPA: DUF523 domain-containing protein [Archangium sp.]|jgi:uncharacterized protein YbbK (DUF523 family)